MHSKKLLNGPPVSVRLHSDVTHMGPWFACTWRVLPIHATHTLLNPPPSGFLLPPLFRKKSPKHHLCFSAYLLRQMLLISPGSFYMNHSLQSSLLDVLPWVFFLHSTRCGGALDPFLSANFLWIITAGCISWTAPCTENSQICTLAATTTWSIGHPHLDVDSTSRSAWMHH